MRIDLTKKQINQIDKGLSAVPSAELTGDKVISIFQQAGLTKEEATVLLAEYMINCPSGWKVMS